MAAMKSESAEPKARAILSGLGFTPDMQSRPTRQFSGGWRMRISLARALFMQPDLLLLDEPTNHLDLNAVIWLEDYLTRWRSTLLVVSHDQDFLSGVVTDIVHLESRKLAYYKGDYDDFKEMFVQKMEKQQKDWEHQQKQLKAAKAKGKTTKEAEEVAKARAKREGAKKGGKRRDDDDEGGSGGGGGGGGGGAELIARPREYTVSFEFLDPPELAPPILAVTNAHFRYGEKYPWLFRDLNFGIDQGSRVAIVGPNGVGKSTLLNLLIGDLEPTEGEVTRNRFLRVGKYSQHFVDVLPMDKSPVETLQSNFGDLNYQDARALLGRFGLEGHAHTIPSRDLSGGQKARVVFASLALYAPHIMVLDEPTNNLDIESIDALCEAIAAYKGGVVLVSHDARLIRACGCRLWVCDKQAVAPFDGDIDDYRESLISQIHAEEASLEELQARLAEEEEARRMEALRLRVRKLREIREAAKAEGAP
jgi:ATP-binding cassette subfamily F protein 1